MVMLAQEMRFVDQPDGTVKFSYRVKKDDWGNYVRIPNSYSGDIVIPSTYNGKTVTAIGDLAFDACVNLTSVSIPNTVKVIEENAFRGCESLVAISIPASVESIDAYAFGNTGLKRVTLEDGSKVLNTWRGGTYNAYTSFSDSPIETLYVGRNLVPGQNPFLGFTTIKYLTFGDQVTGVCANEFKSCKGIRSIDFGQSITSIGNNAFNDCDELGTVTLPESVGTIGEAAFYDCEILAKVNIPNKVRVIHASTFQYCKNLAEIVIPANVDSIGAYAFHYTGLTKVTLEDGDRMLKTWRGGTYNASTPFSGSPIETLYVGRNLQKDMAPFQRFTTIKTLTLSDNVTSVLDYEFYECRGLRTVTFGKNITDIGNSAFRECDTLRTVTLPESVTRIGDAAFYSCDTLSRANIPSKVSLICGDAFNYCKNLTAITIPAIVDSIGAYAFSNTGLTKVTLEDGDKVLKTWRGGTYNASTSFSGSPIETLYVGRNFVKDTAPFQRFSTIKTLTLSDNVTSVLDYEFYECRGLRTVTFGKNITDIGKNAFRECDTLRTVTLPESVTRIGEAAFYSCDTLSRANIPSKVSLICGDAFCYCKNLTAITIPASVDSIGAYAFFETGLKKVTIEDANKMLKTWRGGTYNAYTPFSNSPIETLYVGRNLEEGTAPFQRFTTIQKITLSDNVTVVNDGEFYECRGVRTVNFGQNIATIGKQAFHNCDTLLYAKLPESVTFIGESAFRDCDTLRSVNIPTKLRVIYGSTFESCKNLERITIPASVDSIGAWAFNECNLKRVVIKDSNKPLETWRGGTYNAHTPFNSNDIETLYVGRNLVAGKAPFQGIKSIKQITLSDLMTAVQDGEFYECRGVRNVNFGQKIASIGKQAFQNCDTLLYVNLPESVTYIGESAFRDCDTLRSVNIPTKLRVINGSTFESCGNLERITIPANVDSIGAWAFYDCNLKRVVIKDSNKPLETWRGGSYNANTPFSANPVATLYQGRNFVKGKNPFRGFNKITTLNIGANVTNLYENEYNGCEALKQINSYRQAPPTCEHSNVFNNVDKQACKLNVPSAGLAAYKAADVWKEFFNVDTTGEYVDDDPDTDIPDPEPINPDEGDPDPGTDPQPGGDAIDEFTLWYTLDIGGTVAYKLSEKPQVRLLGAETTVTSSRGVMTFETQKIWKFTLTASSTDPSVGIEEAVAPVQPESEGSVSRSGEALVFSGCRAGEPVGVYTTGGRLVSQHRIAADGTLELSLGSLRPGLYIVKAGSVNIKFMKK